MCSKYQPASIINPVQLCLQDIQLVAIIKVCEVEVEELANIVIQSLRWSTCSHTWSYRITLRCLPTRTIVQSQFRNHHHRRNRPNSWKILLFKTIVVTRDRPSRIHSWDLSIILRSQTRQAVNCRPTRHSWVVRHHNSNSCIILGLAARIVITISLYLRLIRLASTRMDKVYISQWADQICLVNLFKIP